MRNSGQRAHRSIFRISVKITEVVSSENQLMP